MSGGSPAPQPFQPPNQPQVAGDLQGNAAALGQLGRTTTGTAVPGYQSLYTQAVNNPYYGGAMDTANKVAAAGNNFGQQEIKWGQNLAGAGYGLDQFAPGIAATAFDPQNALYNRTQQQITDQARAAAAASGLGGSPYGAGLELQAGRDFNIDWQNQRQQRELAGVSALEALRQAQGGIFGQAGALGTAGLNTREQAGMLPNNVYQQHQQDITSALDALVRGDVASGTPYGQAGALDTSYLGIGQQASQTALGAWQAQKQADSSFWGGLFGGIGQLGAAAIPFIPGI